MFAFVLLVGWVDAAKPTKEQRTTPVVGFAASTHPTSEQPPTAQSKTTDHGQATTDKAWTPKDRETVVLLGSAFIEQEARDGYLETELIRLFPNKDIRVRNLGWSGDTVHCQARSYFGPPQEGFDRLRGHLAMIKPTTVICCYGANESWKGEPGIEGFRKGYEKLIDMIREATGATVVLMTPPQQLTDPSIEKSMGQALARYRLETKYFASTRNLLFIPFGEDVTFADYDRLLIRGLTAPWNLRRGNRNLTMDLSNEINYRSAARRFVSVALGKHDAFEDVEVAQFDYSNRIQKVVSPNARDLAANGNKFSFTVSGLLLGTETRISLKPDASTRHQVFEVHVDGRLKADMPAALLDEGRWECLWCNPDAEAVKLLRQAIVKKNALFFHRWRPANETYLYGFRKHEQGANGVEPPRFDKLVEQAEAEIAVLKKPAPHKYELMRVEEK